MPASVNAAGPSVPSRAKPHKSNARKDASRAHDTAQLLKLVAFDDLLAFYTARRTKKGTIEWKEFPRRSPVDVLKGASDVRKAFKQSQREAKLMQ